MVFVPKFSNMQQHVDLRSAGVRNFTIDGILSSFWLMGFSDWKWRSSSARMLHRVFCAVILCIEYTVYVLKCSLVVIVLVIYVASDLSRDYINLALCLSSIAIYTFGVGMTFFCFHCGEISSSDPALQ